MKIHCVIVDDEKLAQEVLQHHVSKFDQLVLKATCNNVFELIALLNTNADLDLIFLDIKMPEISGLDFVKLYNNPPAIIYTTAFNNYALDAFNNLAIDYLLKPISIDRFSKSIQKASQFLSNKTPQNPLNVNGNDIFYVKSDKRLVKVDPEHILYIEGMRNYICIYTETTKTIVHTTMTAIAEHLQPLEFVCRVHKSFFINLNKIEFVSDHIIVLTNKTNIPIRISYRDLVYEKLKIF